MVSLRFVSFTPRDFIYIYIYIKYISIYSVRSTQRNISFEIFRNTVTTILMMFHSTNPFNEINFLVNNTTSSSSTSNDKENWENINKLNSIDSSIDDDTSLQLVDRSLSSLSTSTSTSAESSVDYFYSDENDMALLRTIDPSPAEPPEYNNVNPSKKITFPIFEHCLNCNNDQLPIYSPAIHSITLGSIRLEYLDPETHESLLKSKIWSNFIIEINSTQLNMYAIDPILLININNYKDSVNPLTNRNLSIQQPQTYKFNKLEKESILSRINQNPKKFLNSGSLRRTYTLQHAEFGLPSDFIRRNRLAQDQVNVLRVRCENQQFLIRLLDIDELIDWSTSLSQGIAVALDLQVRDLPDYRVFPRRRNRHHSRRNSHYNNNSTIEDDIEETDSELTESRSVSPTPQVSVLDPISRSTTNTSRISSSTSSLSLFSTNSTSTTSSKKSKKNPLIKKMISMFNSSSTSPRNDTSRSRSSSITSIPQRNITTPRSKRAVSVTNSIIETERSINQRLTTTTTTTDTNTSTAPTTIHERDEDDMDFYSDDEDEDENDTESSLDEDIKWCPIPKITNRKKHISTSLRCLRVFNETHSWFGKIILKETHNPAKYDTINLPIYFINTATMSKAGSHHMRIKNHCLHPYVLSPNGLIKHGSKVFDLWYEMYN